MLNNAIGNLRTWFSQPFSLQMSATGWFLFFGLLIIISFLWSRILSHIGEAAREIT